MISKTNGSSSSHTSSQTQKENPPRTKKQKQPQQGDGDVNTGHTQEAEEENGGAVCASDGERGNKEFQGL